MKYRVSQSFETLGDSGGETFGTRAEAEDAARKFEALIASDVAKMSTPDEREDRTGNSSEIEAWEAAADLAGVEYNDDGERTEDSPSVYGEAAGQYIAEQAVEIEDVE